jgi:hypothetical protein
VSSHPPLMSWKGQNRGAAWWWSSNPVVTKKSPFDHSFRATPGPAIRSMSGAAVPFAQTACLDDVHATPSVSPLAAPPRVRNPLRRS